MAAVGAQRCPDVRRHGRCRLPLGYGPGNDTEQAKHATLQ
ncbi:MAG: hypothetical protein JWR71_1506 [Pseudarthrobacter sp.]|nr:hypothetical protein [Pseudarthrobacter sp.]